MTDPHDRYRDLLAVHALDALDDTEANEVDRHVAECAACRAELDEHRAVASLIGAQSVEADVPESLWNRVQEGITSAQVRTLRPRAASFVAAVAAAAAMAVLVVVQTARLGDTRDQLVAAEARLAGVEDAIAAGDWSQVAAIAASAPGARSVVLDGDGPTRITLLPDGTGFVIASELGDLPDDRTYQLWIVQRGEVVSAGLLRDGAAGSVFRYDPATLDGLVVTEEEAAGVVVAEGPAVATWFDA